MIYIVTTKIRNISKINIYIFIPSYNILEEVDESPTYLPVCKLGYMCCTYNDTLNGSLKDDSYQGKKSQIYRWYFNSQRCLWVYTNGKTLCRSYMPPTVNIGK